MGIVTTIKHSDIPPQSIAAVYYALKSDSDRDAVCIWCSNDDVCRIDCTDSRRHFLRYSFHFSTLHSETYSIHLRKYRFGTNLSANLSAALLLATSNRIFLTDFKPVLRRHWIVAEFLSIRQLKWTANWVFRVNAACASF